MECSLFSQECYACLLLVGGGGLETLLVFLSLVDREIVLFKRKSVLASMINGHQHGPRCWADNWCLLSLSRNGFY